jgi:ADP-heptose:LPS heptosyltransferase
LGGTHPSKNKEWYPERFQEVASRLQGKASLIQLGSPSDPPIQDALDLRGKTSLRQSAAILAQSLVFIGLEGFMMHLARAVDCRAVIVYGGRLRPSHFGYAAFANLIGATPCSPCWLDNTCDYDRECMKMISTEAVVNAAKEQIDRHGSPLETEAVNL